MKKVIIGISGGVDSAVAAYLLKKDGYDVEGLFMRNWDSSVNNDINGNPTLNNDICTQEEDYNDALKVCEKLGIKLHRIDFVKEYWDYVFTYFLDELNKGRTPNPDIMCNKYIKFDMFKKEAEKLGADYIATGHYARLKDGKLLRAIDNNKDQTYFLAQVAKKDSTGICFIGERNFRNFLKNYLPNKEGDIIDIETKKVIGKHYGLMNYTIGQRRGLNLGGQQERTFVVGKDLNKNVLYVCSNGNNEYLKTDSCLIDTVNLLTDKKTEKCTAKFRYRQQDNEVTLEYLEDGNIIVHYPQGVKSVTPGQACVLYDGEECIGSGIIKEVYKNNEKLWYLP